MGTTTSSVKCVESEMKRFIAVLGTGVGIGFLLGSRAGRQPYETLESAIKEVAARDDVVAATESVAAAANDAKERVLRSGSEKVQETSELVDGAIHSA
jgi:hypothetical protein